jgi:hypothetical protein
VALADEPRSFSRAVVHLLRDVQRRRQLETAARTLVVERYDWSAVAGELESALERVALRGAGASTAAMRDGGVPHVRSTTRSTEGADLRVDPEPLHPR